MRAALVQITSGDDPAANLDTVRGHMRAAAGQGAEFVLTPEVTNCLSASRSHQASVLQLEEDDPTLAGLRAVHSPQKAYGAQATHNAARALGAGVRVDGPCLRNLRHERAKPCDAPLEVGCS